MASLKNALLLVVKQWFTGCADTQFSQHLSAVLGELGVPVCNEIGIKTNHRGCGFILCPTCEIGRRVRFGLHIGAALKGETNASIVHQRVVSESLHGLANHATFSDPATLQFFARLKGLVAVRVSAGYDINARAWIFDRVAVVIGAGPKVSKPLQRRGVVVTSHCTVAPTDHASLAEHVGELADIVDLAVRIGPALTTIIAAAENGIGDVLADIAEARQRWEHLSARFHLLKLVGSRSSAGNADESTQRESDQ